MDRDDGDNSMSSPVTELIVPTPQRSSLDPGQKLGVSVPAGVDVEPDVAKAPRTKQSEASNAAQPAKKPKKERKIKKKQEQEQKKKKSKREKSNTANTGDNCGDTVECKHDKPPSENDPHGSNETEQLADIHSDKSNSNEKRSGKKKEKQKKTKKKKATTTTTPSVTIVESVVKEDDDNPKENSSSNNDDYDEKDERPKPPKKAKDKSNSKGSVSSDGSNSGNDNESLTAEKEAAEMMIMRKRRKKKKKKNERKEERQKRYNSIVDASLMAAALSSDSAVLQRLSSSSTAPITPLLSMRREERPLDCAEYSGGEVSIEFLDSAYMYLQVADAAYQPSIEQAAKLSGLRAENFITFSNKAEIFFPAFFIAIDHARGLIVISVRGSWEWNDWLTNFHILLEYLPPNAINGFAEPSYVHHGFYQSMLSLLKVVIPIVRKQASQYPDYSIRYTGHSLGGAVAALLALVTSDIFPTARAVTFAAPVVGSMNLAEFSHTRVLGFANARDLIPRAAPEKLSKILLKVPWIVLKRCKKKITTFSLSDLTVHIHPSLQTIANTLTFNLFANNSSSSSSGSGGVGSGGGVSTGSVASKDASVVTTTTSGGGECKELDVIDVNKMGYRSGGDDSGIELSELSRTIQRDERYSKDGKRRKKKKKNNNNNKRKDDEKDSEGGSSKNSKDNGLETGSSNNSDGESSSDGKDELKKKKKKPKNDTKCGDNTQEKKKKKKIKVSESNNDNSDNDSDEEITSPRKEFNIPSPLLDEYEDATRISCDYSDRGDLSYQSSTLKALTIISRADEDPLSLRGSSLSVSLSLFDLPNRGLATYDKLRVELFPLGTMFSLNLQRDGTATVSRVESSFFHVLPHGIRRLLKIVADHSVSMYNTLLKGAAELIRRQLTPAPFEDPRARFLAAIPSNNNNNNNNKNKNNNFLSAVPNAVLFTLEQLLDLPGLFAAAARGALLRCGVSEASVPEGVVLDPGAPHGPLQECLVKYAIKRKAAFADAWPEALHAAAAAAEPRPGAGELLALLAARGVPVGVLAEVPGDLAFALLCDAQMGSTVATVVGRGETPRGRPSPAAVLLACQRLEVGCFPITALVGSVEADAVMARNAGVMPVLVGNAPGMTFPSLNHYMNHLETLFSVGDSCGQFESD